jgi:excisionase family DNA binding protein
MKSLKGVVGAAGFLAISTWSVRKLERQKKLKAVRIGRRVLFEEEELERFVAESKRMQAAECQDVCARPDEVTHDNG